MNLPTAYIGGMCGRYVLRKLEEFAQRRRLPPPDAGLFPPELLRARFNIAPTQDVAAQASDGLRVFRWGLVPSWAKDETIGNKLINARAETLTEKPSFRDALVRRRCLVPASAFYEWQKAGDGVRGPKRPHAIFVDDGDLFAFAGLWDRWHDPTDPSRPPLDTLTIVTCEPNRVIRPLHHRMAVILPEDRWDAWLDESTRDPSTLTAMLQPFDADRMSTRSISPAVNDVHRDGPELLEEVPQEPEPVDPQGTLFG